VLAEPLSSGAAIRIITWKRVIHVKYVIFLYISGVRLTVSSDESFEYSLNLSLILNPFFFIAFLSRNFFFFERLYWTLSFSVKTFVLFVGLIYTSYIRISTILFLRDFFNLEKNGLLRPW
jgi:hypothetical protein